VPFKWGPTEQTAFEEIKRIMSKETLLAFPDFTQPFHIFTDASTLQLGAVIVQNGKPLAFYSRKMNSAQQRYTTGEQELLSIVETLKEFRNILLGHEIIVHTDHMNILYSNLSNDRIIRWRLQIEEFGPSFVHVKGKDNIVADALSRLDADFGDITLTTEAKAQICAHALVTIQANEEILLPEANDAYDMAQCFMRKDDIDNEAFPMRPKLIAKEQKRDKELKKSLERSKKAYGVIKLEGVDLLTFEGKIIVPKKLQGRIVSWYHHYLAHVPGQSRLEATIRQNFIWPTLRQDVHRFVRTCQQCQLYKKPRKKYGHLPPKEAETSEPWNRVNVDLIGPLTVRTPNGRHELRALTMIDPATGWFEITEVKSPDAEAAMKAFDDTWLCRYPRPQFIGFDNGSEYKNVFSAMCENYGMEKKLSTSYNPQSNGIVERVHQVLGDALRTFELEQRELDEHEPWRPFLSAAAFAIRSTYHTTLEATPAQLTFGRDMLLPIRFEADWARLKQQRQEAINRNNARENRSRLRHTYAVGDKVLIEKPGLIPKLHAPRTGPYVVEKVNTNGTIRIRRGAISETINIRRVSPFFERSVN
jgi:transposase InsO family protein